jgi:hypothetical protein
LHAAASVESAWCGVGTNDTTCMHVSQRLHQHARHPRMRSDANERRTHILRECSVTRINAHLQRVWSVVRRPHAPIHINIRMLPRKRRRHHRVSLVLDHGVVLAHYTRRSLGHQRIVDGYQLPPLTAWCGSSVQPRIITALGATVTTMLLPTMANLPSGGGV